MVRCVASWLKYCTVNLVRTVRKTLQNTSVQSFIWNIRIQTVRFRKAFVTSLPTKATPPLTTLLFYYPPIIRRHIIELWILSLNRPQITTQTIVDEQHCMDWQYAGEHVYKNTGFAPSVERIALYSPVVTIRTASLTFSNAMFCIYVFCVDLRTNSNYFPIQH
jgi:hypothetical protein